MASMRVHELAKEFDMTSKEFSNLLKWACRSPRFTARIVSDTRICGIRDGP